MRRRIAIILVAPALLWLTFAHDAVPQRPDPASPLLRFTRTAMPSPSVLRRYLGPFALEGAWQVQSNAARVFGFSGLVPRHDGLLMAFNDAGHVLTFNPPGAKSGSAPQVSTIAFKERDQDKDGHDVESVTHDPACKNFWVALEGSNRIVRLSPKLKEEKSASPRLMAGWGSNTGAEAMVRLPDGRFIAIQEMTPSWREPRQHEAVLFSSDPTKGGRGQAFRLDGPDHFSVVDMALLPDGRALILMRRLLWPLPMRFAGRIVIADTAQIRPGQVWRSTPLASLTSILPVDNFEAMAVVSGAKGRVSVWLMSDDNNMRVLQRTLLWKLTTDLDSLPWPR